MTPQQTDAVVAAITFIAGSVPTVSWGGVNPADVSKATPRWNAKAGAVTADDFPSPEDALCELLARVVRDRKAKP